MSALEGTCRAHGMYFKVYILSIVCVIMHGLINVVRKRGSPHTLLRERLFRYGTAPPLCFEVREKDITKYYYCK